VNLVVGSYPPVPGPAAAATVAAVRRAWARGAEVEVASPRPSAARHVLLRHGPSLGRELASLRRRLACDEIVVCAEPGWPFPAARAPLGTGASLAAGMAHAVGADRLVRTATAARTATALAGAIAGARRAELVLTGSRSDWEPLLPALAPLWPLLTVVVASSEPLAAAIRTGLPASAPMVRVAPVGAVFSASPAVGPLEPGELQPATRARRLAGRLARAVLGEREPAVHAYAAGLFRPVVRMVRSLVSP
jgi:hypothetical protein